LPTVHLGTGSPEIEGGILMRMRDASTIELLVMAADREVEQAALGAVRQTAVR
jgi:hypothetical protein